MERMLGKPARLILAILLMTFPIGGQTPDDRYPFGRDGKIGFIDHTRREVIPPRFGNAGDWAHFENGLAPVFEAGVGSGYIDISGKFVIGPTQVWGWGRPFHEDVACVLIWNQQGNRAGWIDRQGKFLFSGMGVEGTYFSEGLMSMPGPNGKWGFVDKYFKFVIPPQFDYAYEFSEGLAEVTVNRKSGFIDKAGKVIVPLRYDMAWSFHDGLARVRRDVELGTRMTMHGEQPNYRYQYGFIDHAGNEVIPLQFEDATHFSGNYAMAVPSEFKLYGVIDKQGNFVHEPAFEAVGQFSEGLAMACVKQKCGYVNTRGEWAIPPTFVFARDFRRGLASVSWKEGVYGYVDKTGKIVWKNTDSPKASQ